MEQIAVPDAKPGFEYPVWPPKAAIDLVQWW
jgi:hypothetical protein